MTLGVVMADAHWAIVQPTLRELGVVVEWVSHDHAQALTFLAVGGLRAVWVEADPRFLTPELVATADQAGVKVLALLTHPDAASLADQRGVGHRVSTPADLMVHLGIDPPPAMAVEPSATGFQVAVWGPTGAPGRTTMAVTLAALLQQSGFQVGLIDADPRGGAVSAALGLLDDVPGWFAACRLARRDELTPEECNRLATWYRVGATEFPVLTGLARHARLPEPGAETATRMIDATREWREVVVWDCGSDLPSDDLQNRPDPAHDFTHSVLSGADHLVAVCRADPIGVARFGRVWAEVRRLRPALSTTVLLNGVNEARRAVKEESALREALRTFADVPHAVAVSRDDDGVRSALMAAVSLADLGGRHRLVESLRPVVATLSGQIRPPVSSPRQIRPTPRTSPRAARPFIPGMVASARDLWRKLTAVR